MRTEVLCPFLTTLSHPHYSFPLVGIFHRGPSLNQFNVVPLLILLFISRNWCAVATQLTWPKLCVFSSRKMSRASNLGNWCFGSKYGIWSSSEDSPIKHIERLVATRPLTCGYHSVSHVDLDNTTVYYCCVCMLTKLEVNRVVFPCGVNHTETTKSLPLKYLI